MLYQIVKNDDPMSTLQSFISTQCHVETYEGEEVYVPNLLHPRDGLSSQALLTSAMQVALSHPNLVLLQGLVRDTPFGTSCVVTEETVKQCIWHIWKHWICVQWLVYQTTPMIRSWIVKYSVESQLAHDAIICHNDERSLSLAHELNIFAHTRFAREPYIMLGMNRWKCYAKALELGYPYSYDTAMKGLHMMWCMLDTTFHMHNHTTMTGQRFMSSIIRQLRAMHEHEIFRLLFCHLVDPEEVDFDMVSLCGSLYHMYMEDAMRWNTIKQTCKVCSSDTLTLIEKYA